MLVLGVGLLVGFRPTATPVERIAAIGMIALIAFAITWLAVAMGIHAKSVERASNLPLLLVLAVGWCVVIAGAGYTWSMAIYERKSVR